VSCTEFFTKTLAPWAARDPASLIPPVTTGNIGDLIEMTQDNPDNSLALLDKIKDAANKASGDEKSRLQAAALETASNAAGLGQAIISNAGKLTSVDTEDDARKLVTDAINSMKNLNESASLLTAIVPQPAEPFDPENIDDPFNKMAASAAVDDLAMAALVIIAAEAKTQEQTHENGVDGYVDDLKDKIDNNELNDNENLAKAMALAATLESRQDELSPSLKDALSGLNLFQKT
jgi:hypothetical protein